MTIKLALIQADRSGVRSMRIHLTISEQLKPLGSCIAEDSRLPLPRLATGLFLLGYISKCPPFALAQRHACSSYACVKHVLLHDGHGLSLPIQSAAAMQRKLAMHWVCHDDSTRSQPS